MSEFFCVAVAIPSYGTSGEHGYDSEINEHIRSKLRVFGTTAVWELVTL